MDMQEILELKKKYAVMPDEEIIDMLLEGKDKYVEGAYELLLGEAGERGIEEIIKEKNEAGEIRKESVLSDEKLEPETFVQLMIVNNEVDLVFLKSVLGEEGASYYSQELSLKGASLPVSLMVAEPRVQEVRDLLKGFKPEGSIILW